MANASLNGRRAEPADRFKGLFGYGKREPERPADSVR